MGYPHYVLIWVKHPEDGDYYYKEVYSGRSWFQALRAFIKAKKQTGCVKWEWRG